MKNKTPAKQAGSMVELMVYSAGIYISFVSWSLLQERITTKPYGEHEEYFNAPLFINIVQAAFASFIGFVYYSVKHGGLSNPFYILKNLKILGFFCLVSITTSVSSPIGYRSLNHIDYLGFLLAKSCKLIPVMLVHMLVYRTRFPTYKILVALSVTLGVVVFTLNHSKKRESNNDGRTLLGMTLLISSLFLDGITNSTQDYMFKRFKKISGANLMCLLNFLNFVFTFAYAFFFTTQISYSVDFISRHPPVLANILSFAVFGSIGQIFIFVLLERFDSTLLITITVTRKMMSMLLSVFLFGHTLSWKQWGGVSLVFGGLSLEGLAKYSQSKKKTKVV